MELLDHWIARQYQHSAASMLRSVSCGIVKSRPGFAQLVRASQGSIVASPVLGSYDPEPDYFFHWYRDSAIVVDALRILDDDPHSGLDTRQHVADFVRFSLSLRALDGRALSDGAWRGQVDENFRGYLRDATELSRVFGNAVSDETRVNPDGSLDISRWPRPQYDGSAMRALSILRWLRTQRFDAAVHLDMETLLRGDLTDARRCARLSCFDIWEEEQGRHYYTLRVTAAALRAGAEWLAQRGDYVDSQLCDTAATELMRQLDGYWVEPAGYLKSRVLDSGMASSKDLDISVVLAANHAGTQGEPHSAGDARVAATVSHLERLFDAAYPINRARPPDQAPAMGRYAGDVYFSGGAYYFATLGTAEFYFKAAASAADPTPLRARGDAFLRTVQAFTPSSGDMSEQFDQQTGLPRSARHLAWSYAAFISCIAARRLVTD